MSGLVKYDTLVGLEIHIELNTESKAFCSCKASFGDKPNTNCCPVCTGFPGTLPSLNKKAVEYAVMAGISLNCTINEYSKFDRKNYFYPDLPKSYQITQKEFPICTEGYLMLSGGKRIEIKEMHIEEDAGKLIHDSISAETLVDFNRAGVPLLEIVTYPFVNNDKEAVDFLNKLKAIIKCIGISDCRMEEGSLRVDLNISIREHNKCGLGTKIEIKNLNSFKSVEKAIMFEETRQKYILENGGGIVEEETRRWDETLNETVLMRSKERENDYKYFPEPDLPPVILDRAYIENIGKTLPELPERKQRRFIKEYGITEYEAKLICSSAMLSDMFEGTSELCGEPKEVAKLLLGDYLKLLKEFDLNEDNKLLDCDKLSDLICMIKDCEISRETAKDVFRQIFTDNVNPREYVETNNLMLIKDKETVKGIIDDFLKAGDISVEKAVNDYKKGINKAFGFLLGKTMRLMKGRASAELIREILKDLLDD